MTFLARSKLACERFGEGISRAFHLRLPCRPLRSKSCRSCPTCCGNGAERKNRADAAPRAPARWGTGRRPGGPPPRKEGFGAASAKNPLGGPSQTVRLGHARAPPVVSRCRVGYASARRSTLV